MDHSTQDIHQHAQLDLIKHLLTSECIQIASRYGHIQPVAYFTDAIIDAGTRKYALFLESNQVSAQHILSITAEQIIDYKNNEYLSCTSEQLLQYLQIDSTLTRPGLLLEMERMIRKLWPGDKQRTAI